MCVCVCVCVLIKMIIKNFSENVLYNEEDNYNGINNNNNYYYDNNHRSINNDSKDKYGLFIQCTYK